MGKKIIVLSSKIKVPLRPQKHSFGITVCVLWAHNSDRFGSFRGPLALPGHPWAPHGYPLAPLPVLHESKKEVQWQTPPRNRPRECPGEPKSHAAGHQSVAKVAIEMDNYLAVTYAWWPILPGPYTPPQKNHDDQSSFNYYWERGSSLRGVRRATSLRKYVGGARVWMHE